MTDETTKKAIGFARMTPEQHAEICRKGGVSAHRSGVAHRWKSGEEARRIGKLGSQKRLANRAAKNRTDDAP
jgi:general stress protein YciG